MILDQPAIANPTALWYRLCPICYKFETDDREIFWDHYWTCVAKMETGDKA